MLFAPRQKLYFSARVSVRCKSVGNLTRMGTPFRLSNAFPRHPPNSVLMHVLPSGKTWVSGAPQNP